MGETLRVLFVGDDPADAHLLQQQLEQGGYRVESRQVQDEEGMKSALKEQSWDLIIGDYTLAQFDALSALKLLRASGRDIPFILVSDEAGEERAVEVMRAGARDFLLKHRLARFLPAVRRELDQARERGRRREAEGALFESEDLFRKLSESSLIGIWMADPRGRWVYANPCCRAMLGLPLMQAVGEGWLSVLHPLDQPAVHEAWKSYVESGSEFDVEFRVRGTDGSLRWVRCRAVPHRSENGELLSHVGTTEDITGRKSAEQVGQMAARLWQETFDAVNEALLILDTEQRILQCNNAAKGMFLNGHGPTAGRQCYEVVHGTSEPHPECPMRRMRTSLRRESSEMKVADRWFHVTVDPIFDAEGHLSGAVHTVEDVSERKRAEERLRDSEQRLRLHVQRTPLAVIEWDLDFRVVKWNPSAKRIFGYTEQEALGQHAYFIVPSSARPHVDRIWSALLHSKGGLQSTNENVTKDGRTILCQWYNTPLVNEKGEVVGVASLAADITEQKRAEAALHESERRYRELVEHLPDVVFTLSREGIITSLNTAFERLLEWPVSEWVGRSFTLLVHPDDLGDTQAAFLAVLGGRSPVPYELRLLTRSGKHLWVEFSVIPQKQGERTIGLLGIGRDVTERKRIENSLRQTQKMNALGQMASGIAHDINNNLACVLGFSELLLSHPSQLDDKKKVADYLQRINAAAHDASRVVERLREFYRSRDHLSPLAAVDLNAVVRDTIAMSEPRWKTQTRATGLSIAVQTELGEVPLIYGDASELREALMNLIFNAVDAMHGDGTITIRTRTVGEREPTHVIVQVSDTGVGMTEEVRQRCLEPFFTTKGESGTGLGLSMVYGVVQRHQGSLDIESAPGKGTTVTLTLPVRVVPAEQRLPAVSVQHRRNLRILVVEDEPILQEVLVAYLVESGHFVETASDGVQGLQKFKAGRFDVVITDHVMPRMNGLEMAAAIKAVRPGQPVVLVSGHDEALENGRAHSEVVDYILGKPVAVAALRTAVTTVTSARENKHEANFDCRRPCGVSPGNAPSAGGRVQRR